MNPNENPEFAESPLPPLTRCWLAADGVTVVEAQDGGHGHYDSTGSGHSKAALTWFAENHPDRLPADRSNRDLELRARALMFQEGFVRIAPDQAELVIEGNANQKQIDAAISRGRLDGLRVVHVRGTSAVVIWTPSGSGRNKMRTTVTTGGFRPSAQSVGGVRPQSGAASPLGKTVAVNAARPHFSSSLEALREAARASDASPSQLKAILHELGYRKARGASGLRDEVSRRVNDLAAKQRGSDAKNPPVVVSKGRGPATFADIIGSSAETRIFVPAPDWSGKPKKGQSALGGGGNLPGTDEVDPIWRDRPRRRSGRSSR